MESQLRGAEVGQGAEDGEEELVRGTWTFFVGSCKLRPML